MEDIAGGLRRFLDSASAATPLHRPKLSLPEPRGCIAPGARGAARSIARVDGWRGDVTILALHNVLKQFFRLAGLSLTAVSQCRFEQTALWVSHGITFVSRMVNREKF